jgi:hypothetical protein
MRTILKLAAALVAVIFASSLFADTITIPKRYRNSAGVTFTALSANGSTASYDTEAVMNNHTVTVVPTGGPSGCTLTMEGSLDGTNWFTIITAATCTSVVSAHGVDKPARYVRGTLSALAGGTTPTVTVKYVGAR